MMNILNLNISDTMTSTNLKFSLLNLEPYRQGMLSQNFDLDPTVFIL